MSRRDPTTHRLRRADPAAGASTAASIATRAVFERELEAIWHKVWVYVGHESEIPKPGDLRAAADRHGSP